jgi:hypothetical protein
MNGCSFSLWKDYYANNVIYYVYSKHCAILYNSKDYYEPTVSAFVLYTF